ncbi:MAG: hypothetical protein ACW99Q_06370, partial [Candidatus Kariarchaeaceae archaeon]
MTNYKEITSSLIQCLNTRNFANLDNFFAENATINSFSTQKGEYEVVHGRKKITDLLMVNFNPDTDFQVRTNRILVSDNVVS